MLEHRSRSCGAHELKMPRTKKREHAPKNLWSIPEVAPTLFLRSRRVRDRAIITILSERYAPTVRKIGAVSLKLRITLSIHLWSGKFSEKALVRPRSETNLVSQCGSAVPGAGYTGSGIKQPPIPQLRAREGRKPDQVRNRKPPSSSMQPNKRHVLARNQPSTLRMGSQMSGFLNSNPNVRPNEAGWPMWDATLETLFPNMGPLPFHGGFPFGVQQAAGNGGAQDLLRDRCLTSLFLATLTQCVTLGPRYSHLSKCFRYVLKLSEND